MCDLLHWLSDDSPAAVEIVNIPPVPLLVAGDREMSAATCSSPLFSDNIIKLVFSRELNPDIKIVEMVQK